ncbi:MAG: phosphoribosylaminoimidazolesuccinocarboxamide synthase [Candidatus Dadabacteria bacterium]|nr:phosphoribosylaminoimidazolesuccinocarboxamide synthase [Candidatus Dadabacteria bacterium]NIS08369.1 phosphoribosylaminoimidazolesuccinocarboxamide synthase [Candidatus Dadabacteria bacterium]NIY21506.1 phosphoribosylaminoimidazolesuccinocarboxamide synthase [Candidatus Dadabacteria bacterium]
MVLDTEDYIKNVPKPKKGKVRDIYELGDKLLIVSTDRISAFDVIIPNGIPAKGKILNQISCFWFEFTKDIVKNHIISCDVDDFPHQLHHYADILGNRSMLVQKTKPLPVECIVRGYIAGSGWKEYKETGSTSGITLPKGLRESEKFTEPLFTPSTKAEIGLHDENISYEAVIDMIGEDLSCKLKEISISIYQKAHDYALSKGIIIADTKFEFGQDLETGEVILIDEVLTPDSSRFWPLDEYEPGRPQKSFDKQFVRDYLHSLDWDKTPPAPMLPDDIVQKTKSRYEEVYKILTS